MHHRDCLPQPKQRCPSVHPAHGRIHPFQILCSYSYSLAQLCPTLCIVVVNVELLNRMWLFWDLVDCSPPGSSDHGDAPGKSTGVGCHYSLSSWKVIFSFPHPLSGSSQFDSPLVPAVRSFFCGWVRVFHISHPLAGFLFPALHSSLLTSTLHINVLPKMQIRSSQPLSLKHFSTSLTAAFLFPKDIVCAPCNGPKDPASSGP